MLLVTFIGFLLLFLAIGLASYFFSQKTTEDYLVAGKSVPPALVGLSAIATNNSGFLFIGMVGMTYSMGLSTIWFAIGWILGDLLVNLTAVKPIQTVSRRENIHSYGGLLAHWQGGDFKKVRLLAGVLTLVFLTVYAAAQLKAGAKATQSLLDWTAESGIIISAVIILIYSFVGGLRASIWTDVAQSIVMIGGMLLLLVVGVAHFDGIGGTLYQLYTVSETYMSLFNGTFIELLLFILGWMAGGMGVLGQPHIVIRFMTLDKVENVNRMRVYYYLWFTIAFLATVAVGLLTRLFIPEIDGFDAELALPTMANNLLPQFLVGMVLAAMFAATMSTADSLILACSASITRDIIPNRQVGLLTTKLFTFLILMTAMLMALSNSDTVFTLVLYAWGILSAAFAPLIMVYAMGKNVSEKTALIMMISGPLAYMLWRGTEFAGLLYAVAPGILTGLLVYVVMSKLETQTSQTSS